MISTHLKSPRLLKHILSGPQRMFSSLHSSISMKHVRARVTTYIVIRSLQNLKVVLADWKVKTPCHAHGECIN